MPIPDSPNIGPGWSYKGALWARKQAPKIFESAQVLISYWDHACYFSIDDCSLHSSTLSSLNDFSVNDEDT